ncbi:MAG: GxxExxY protein [Verrucomicrobiota bacterium]
MKSAGGRRVGVRVVRRDLEVSHRGTEGTEDFLLLVNIPVGGTLVIMEEISEELNRISGDVVDVAMRIHKDLGPGLLETVYSVILAKKLEHRGYSVQREVEIPIEYEGMKFIEGFRADLVIEKKLIVELKSVEKLAPVHAKQLLTYMKLTSHRLGLLINFGENLLKNGIKRVAN